MITYILNSFFFSILGLVLGFVIHFFEALVEPTLSFSKRFFKHIIKFYLRLSLMFFFCSIIIGFLLFVIASSNILGKIIDTVLVIEISYYILCFASFDFAIKKKS